MGPVSKCCTVAPLTTRTPRYAATVIRPALENSPTLASTSQTHGSVTHPGLPASLLTPVAPSGPAPLFLHSLLQSAAARL